MSRPYRERVATFGVDRGLIGVLTMPAVPRGGAPAVVLLNSGIIHRVGSNRMSVNMARALGAAGIVSLRFDYAGIGDSERSGDGRSLRASVERDVGAALDYLAETQGVGRFVLMGLCSGAYDTMHAARGDPRVVGALMVDLPGPFRSWRHTFHHLRRRILRVSSWSNPLEKLLRHSRDLVGSGRNGGPAVGRQGPPVYVVGGRSTPTRQWMDDQIDALLARDVRLAFVFTAGIQTNYNHRSQFRTTFPRAARHPGVTHDFYPDADHAFSARADRDRLIDATVRWMHEQSFRGAAAAPQG